MSESLKSASKAHVNNIPFISLVGVVSALYLSQGLPGGLIAHALPAFLREAGWSLTVIGSLKLLALPWLLKFIWAPYTDNRGTFEQRRQWIVRMQLLCALSLFALSFFVSRPDVEFLALSLVCLLLLNLSSSTQDIATDGLAASLSPPGRLGIVNSIQVIGYKVGMLIGGSALLYFSGWVPITNLMLCLASFLIVLLVPLFLFQRQNRRVLKAADVDKSSDDLNQGFIDTYKGFFSQSAILSWLLVLLTYKLADSFGSAMLKPLLIDIGIDKSEIGSLTFYSSLAGLVGAALSGWLYKKWSALSCLLMFGVLQSVSVSSFYLITTGSLSLNDIYALVMFEQFSDGLSTVALFALMMRHCRAGHEGADYTVQASIQIVLAGVLGAVSGALADAIGYASLYHLCVLLGVFSFFIVLNYKRAQTRMSV